MINLFPSQKYGILKYYFVGSSLILGLVSTTLYLTNKPENLIVAIEDGNIRVINQNEIIPQELISFLEMFLKTSYNYSYLSIKQTVDSSSNLMSDKLWELKRSEITNSIELLTTQKYISKLTDIKDIKKESDFQYTALISQEIQTQDKKLTRFLNIKITLSKKERTKTNPSIYEVADYAESEIK